MRRAVDEIANGSFDLLVVGGGILGVCVARDAALRGLRVALLEARDLAAGASSNNLKVAHGGFRYLRGLQLRRMRRSIRERRTWLRAAPHLVEPLPVLLPIAEGDGAMRAGLGLALRLNDLVGSDRDRGVPADRRLPRGSLLGWQECRRLVPQLDGARLPGGGRIVGGARFHDALFYSPERAVIEVLESACRAGAVAANHVRVVEARGLAGDLVRVKCRDHVGQGTFETRARLVVNAAGGEAEKVAVCLMGGSSGARSPVAVGVNLVLDAAAPEAAFAVPIHEEPEGALELGDRHLFVVPWQGFAMVGTAYYGCSAPPDPEACLRMAGPRASRFLEFVARRIPGLAASEECLRNVHVGLVPLEASRLRSAPHALLSRPRLLDHGRDGFPRLLTAVTEKFTTARALAEAVTDLAFSRLGFDPPPCRTAYLRLPGGTLETVERLLANGRARYETELEPEVVEQLVRCYGARVHEVLASRAAGGCGAAPLRRVVPEAPVIRAQLCWAVAEEMACAPEDAVSRRTELGERGLAGAAAKVALDVLASVRHARGAKTVAGGSSG